MTNQTLQALAGLPRHPSPLDQAVLVLIDHQYEYVDGRLILPGIDRALAAMAALIALARRSGTPVIHVGHRGRPGGLFDPDGRGGAIIETVAPLPGEAVIWKPAPNAFAKTDLDAQIRALGRTELILAGFASHMCIDATARAALDLGYRTTIVADATATRDLPDALGDGVISAADLKRASLAGLADRFAIVVKDASAWR